MPAQPIGVWGIDLGQCGLKAIRLQEIDGQLVATAFDYVEHPKILSQPDADPDQLTREALDKFLSRNNLRGDIVAISVPGQSGLARFVKLPPVEEKKIADIVRFEAKQQIPFNLDEVVWDYQKIGSGAVTDGFAMETEIGLFAMKRDMVNRYLQHFKDVNVDIHLVQMAPLALCNYVAFDLLSKDAEGGEGGDKKCVVALDIGADSSNLVITDGERIIWQRPIPLGGNHFTRALTKDLKLTFAKAEHVKRNATKSPDLKKILAALKPVLNDFVGEVQRSLGYFTNTHRDAHIEYMIGLGNAFRLPGLQKFLSEKLQLEVRKLGKMERISGDQVVAQQAYTENVLTFAVAYGLALQGLKRARLLTNLLPDEIRVERLVKAKKPFAIAAAAALLLACGGLMLSYALEYRTYGDSRVTKAMDASKIASDKAAKAKSAFEAAKKRVSDEENAVRTIVAGQFERSDWPELYKFINTAVPQPDDREHIFPIPADDGSVAKEIKLDNIPKEFEARYGGKKAEQAYMEYLRRRTSGGSAPEDSGKADELPPGAQNLIQFNIESVQGFYCDNLSTYWDLVKRSDRVKSNRDFVRPLDHFGTVKAEGAGWVIEVHGWTYHWDKESFIKNTILENLARLGVRETKTDAAPATGAPAGTPPANPAAAAAPTAVGGADKKEGQEDLGPVLKHISHVVLYKTASSSANGPFEILNEATHEEVKALVLGQASSSASSGVGGLAMPGMAPGGPPGGMPGSGGMGPGGPPGAGGVGGGGDKASSGPSRGSWTPLGGQGAAPGFMGGMGGMGMRGGASGIKPPGMAGNFKMPNMPGGRMPGMPGGGKMPAMPGMMPGGKAPGEAGPEGAKQDRTEFVILFIWKEPTFSDGLRGLSAASSGSSTSTASSPSGPSTPPRKRQGKKGGGGRRRGR